MHIHTYRGREPCKRQKWARSPLLGLAEQEHAELDTTHSHPSEAGKGGGGASKESGEKGKDSQKKLSLVQSPKCQLSFQGLLCCTLSLGLMSIWELWDPCMAF